MALLGLCHGVTRAQDAPRSRGPGTELTLPSLSGLSCDEARKRLIRIKVELTSCDPGKRTGQVGVGLINEQYPVAGTTVPSDRRVTAWTEPPSQARKPPPPKPPPEDRFVVPDLRGATCDEAQAHARANGFPSVKCIEQSLNDKTPPGRVREQKPERGTVLPKPVTISAWLQPLIPKRTVPDVVGRPVEEAQRLVERAELLPRVTGPAADTGRIVAASDPPAGNSVDKGSRVSLQAQLVVPRLGGLGCDAARARAAAHGFGKTDCKPGHAPDAPADKVFAQDPEAGGRFDKAVLVTVSLAIAQVEVPDVTGQGVGKAEGALKAVGLRAQPDASSSDRVVRKQDPAPHQHVDRGTRVRLTTVREVVVPNVIGLSCETATRHAEEAGLRLRCENDAQTFTLSTPVVVTQDVPAGTLRDEGERFGARARAPVPWVAVGMAAVLGALGLGWTLRRLRGPGTPSQPPPGPAVTLHGESDPAPSVHLRIDDGRPDAGGIALRGEPDAGRAFVHGLPVASEPGDEDEQSH
jgi:beta-lactam-binding protein with PASTA domain